MDPSFVRSVTTEGVWKAVGKELASGRNIWNGLIEKFGLLEVPYATASAPSRTLLRKRDTEKRERLNNEITKLVNEFHSENPQQALSAFKEQELSHTAVIQKIASEVPRPPFTENPPLTPDDQAQHRQLHIAGVSALEVLFERPPTIDLVLSFDLRGIPPRYYRYLPVFPRMLDSLGLRNNGAITSYSALLAEVEKHNYKFSVGYDSDVNSKRVELTIQISALNVVELRESLKLLQKMMISTNITEANLSRIQDVIAKQRSNDDNYTRQEQMWIREIPTAVRYEDDELLFAMNSHFTQAHWDDGLFWRLHNRVFPRDLKNLTKQLQRALDSFHGMSRQQIEMQLTVRPSSGLQREVFDYWKRNMNEFPDSELVPGLEKLASEIIDDLRKGPTTGVSELKQLQKAMFNRKSLRVNITLDKRSQVAVESAVTLFVRRTSATERDLSPLHSRTNAITEKLTKRYPSFSTQYPWYLALRHEEAGTGGAVFTAVSPGYGEVDRDSLIKFLASKRLSGAGPESLYMRTWEVGLAYNNGLISNPRSQLTTYYADRSPDLVNLVEFVNSIVGQLKSVQGGKEIDYLLSQTFSVPRSMLTFSDRGVALARDIRDGASPDKIRRFSQAILDMRKDSELSDEVSKAEFTSICPVLLDFRCKAHQQAARSIFFFVGPENLLAGVENRLRIQNLAYVWPSDFWLQ
jgi:Zn-dependent M16 (insulinase) family peptidase